MEVVFLGYRDLDFTSDDGKHIDGVKFFYYSEKGSTSKGYFGYECIGYFLDRSNPLCQKVAKLVPGSKIMIDFQFDGKRASLVDLG